MNLEIPKLSILSFLVLTFCSGCFAKPSSLDLQEIREVVYRYEIAHSKADVYFLSDEDQVIIQKLSAEGVSVKPASMSSRDKDFYVIDKNTGNRGISLGIMTIKRQLFMNKCMVRTTRYWASEGKEGYDIRLTRENGTWIVKSAAMVFVS